jgi:prepilin-type N-terminal cleavage/methylation domain-containing protein
MRGRAFTLFELLVTMGIILILTGMLWGVDSAMGASASA